MHDPGLSLEPMHSSEVRSQQRSKMFLTVLRRLFNSGEAPVVMRVELS